MNEGRSDISSWSSILKQARLSLDSGETIELETDEFKEPIRTWKNQISAYNMFLSQRGEKQPLLDSEKAMIVETRSALRFALICFSTRDDHSRATLQSLVCTEHQWHVELSCLLSHDRGDSKCRVFAARLFSNLVAANDIS
eukprot:CAMPEP_0176139054 /NCGR_PEP_ID=MMETSP0120_2-20121206/70644_1 /TAXON_ID=160619 /ORGANISM="Kryptoperidinium foliaceum, Strain CCMP 1326" /LENGTH=140 /DNA_ID=CAMNT_0017475021 /DNA_START=257 /DNA_END=676 /DNA_ORIENTATION=-